MRDLSGLAVFVKVIELGSFSSAARSMGTSPSSVSKQISRLESEVGARLISRSTHHLILTEAGRNFFERAARIVNEIDAAIHDVRDVSENLTGVIRVHLSPGTGVSIVLAPILDFMKLHPALDLQLTLSPPVFDLLSQGIDLSVYSADQHDAGLKHASIKSVKLTAAEYRIVAAREYLKRFGQPKHPNELKDHRCLVCTTHPSSKEWWFHDRKKRYSVIVDPCLEANEWSAVNAALIAGLGIARALTVSGTKRPEHRGLIYLFSDLIDADRSVSAFYPRIDPMPKKLQALLAHLRNHFASARKESDS